MGLWGRSRQRSANLLIYIFIYMFVCVSVCMCVYVCVCVSIYIYIYAWLDRTDTLRLPIISLMRSSLHKSRLTCVCACAHARLFGLVWFYSISTIESYLIPNSFLYIQIALFQTVQFSISSQFISIYPIGATTPGQTGPGSDGNKGVLLIPQKLPHYWSLNIRLQSV